jgi:iron(III) transport system ATP-binding protein
VSDFVGKVNFLKGTVVAGDAGNGKIELAGIGQSIPYQGPCTGKVVVAIRPENIVLSPPKTASFPSGVLEGALFSMFYLGDINDCRVKIDNEIFRVIAGSDSFDSLKEGQKITIGLKEFLVFEDEAFPKLQFLGKQP